MSGIAVRLDNRALANASGASWGGYDRLFDNAVYVLPIR